MTLRSVYLWLRFRLAGVQLGANSVLISLAPTPPGSTGPGLGPSYAMRQARNHIPTRTNI
jgi:hypothetical protein